MTEWRRVLRTTGVVLLIAGLLDIGVMIYCIANRISYTSSFNVFAVIAGILLLKGSLRTARAVAWFSGFLLGAMPTALIVYLAHEPPGLLLTRFRLAPLATLSALLGAITAMALVAWVHRRLTCDAVMSARAESGLGTSKPLVGTLIGALFSIGVGIVAYAPHHGHAAREVISTARNIHGEAHDYHIRSIQRFDESLTAELVAYNDREIAPLILDCSLNTDGRLITCSVDTPR